MTTLVTGAAGFIGSHLVTALEARRDAPVRVVDRSCDLRVYENACLAVQGAYTVYHLAADMGGIGYNLGDHAAIASENALIDSNVLRACREYGVKRFLYASSATVYPSWKLGALREHDVYPFDPDPGYGWAKLFGEQLTAYYGKSLEVRVVRFQNVYGERAAYDGPKEKALTALCRKVALAKDGDVIEVWGDGSQIRDFTFVDDAVAGMLRVMDSGYSGPVNVATGIPTTVNEMARQIIKISGKHLSIRNDLSKPTGARGRYADCSLLKGLTGWNPTIGIASGLPITYRWVLEDLEARSRASSAAPSTPSRTPTPIS